MTQRLLSIGLALSFTLALAGPAAAQGGAARALDDWTAVQTLAPGQKIVVRTKDGDRLTGRFDSANDLLLNFTDGKRKVSLTRESIKLVQLDRGNSRGKGTLIGALIGAGAGFTVGAIIYLPYKDDISGMTVPAFAGIGAGIGAGFGASTGKGNKNETVYEAP